MTPALLTRTSIGPVAVGERAHRGQVGQVERAHRRRRRSSCRGRRSPFAVLRQASTTGAPRPASARAVASPSPLLAPVTTTVRPVWSGMSAAVQFGMAEL